MSTSTAARQFAAWAPLAGVLIVLLPAPAAAQETVPSFDRLNTRLKIGDKVSVTDIQGREFTGKLTGLQDASITMEHDGPTTIQADTVRLVERRTKSVGKAALWGLLIGGALGAISGSVDSSCDTGDCISGPGAGFLLGAGFGAGIGAAVRAVLPAGRKVVYRAAGAGPAARLSIAPVITPRTKGVAVTVAF